MVTSVVDSNVLTFSNSRNDSSSSLWLAFAACISSTSLSGVYEVKEEVARREITTGDLLGVN